MAFPEDQIATAHRAKRNVVAESFLHHVGIARRGLSGSLQRGLDQAGTIQPCGGLAAPDIRHAQKAFGDGDKILFSQRFQMALMNMLTLPDLHIFAPAIQNRDARIKRQTVLNSRLQIGREENWRHQGGNSCIRSEKWPRLQFENVTDIEIVLGLAPQPGPLFIDGEDLAEQKFAILVRCKGRLNAQGGAANTYGIFHACRVARRIHLAFQMRRRQVRPRRCDPSVGFH